MKRRYMDFYGNNATISDTEDGKYLVHMDVFGGVYHTCATLNEARLKLRALSLGWREVDRDN